MNRIMKGVAGVLILMLGFITAVLCMLSMPQKRTEERQGELLVQYIRGGYYETEAGVRQVEDASMGGCLIRPGDQTVFPDAVSFQFTDQMERPVFILDGSGRVIWEQRLGSGTHRIEIPKEAEVISLAVTAGEANSLHLVGYGPSDRAETKYTGKRLSVLGDSISAYEHYIPEPYRPFYNQSHFNVQSMWWAQTAERTGMAVCRINACGGSGFAVPDEETDGNPLYADSSRCEDLSGVNGDPDVILILLGANDYAQGVGPEEIGERYESVVGRIRQVYSEAEIYLCTYYGFTAMTPEQTEALNGIIRETAKKTDVGLIDSSVCGIVPGGSSTLDGVHPNKRGQALLGACIGDALLNEGAAH